jgi:hypothetical protein
MRFDVEGAGKGDKPRDVERDTYSTNFERIFGKKQPPKEFKRTTIVYGNKREEKRNRAFFVPDTTPRFNQGLGCITNGTRDAENKAKRLGLTPIGDVPIDKVFSRSEEKTSRAIAEEIIKENYESRRIVL